MKATLKNGITVEGTPREIADVIRALGNRRSATPAEYAGVAGEASLQWTERTMGTFWKLLSPEQKRLIQYTRRQKGPVTLKQLMHHLGKNNGIKVAGLLAAITRHGHSAAGEESYQVIETVRNEGGKCYEISPEVRERLEEFLSREERADQ